MVFKGRKQTTNFTYMQGKRNWYEWRNIHETMINRGLQMAGVLTITSHQCSSNTQNSVRHNVNTKLEVVQLKSKFTALRVISNSNKNQNNLTSAVAHDVQPGSADHTGSLALMSDGCSTQDRGLRPGPGSFTNLRYHCRLQNTAWMTLKNT